MCKLVLFALFVILIVIMVVAAVVVQEYGWVGFLILLGAMVVVAVAARFTFPRLLRHLFMRPLRRMGAVLQGATIVVHSVVPAEAPPEEQHDDDDNDAAGAEAIADRDEEEEVLAGEADAVVRYDWYRVEFTVVPPGPNSSEGRTLHRQSWSPGLVSAIYVRPGQRVSFPYFNVAEDGNIDEFDFIQPGELEWWNGAEFVPPQENVFGEQRLRLHFGVTQRIREATITYASFTEIGRVPLPRLDVQAERDP